MTLRDRCPYVRRRGADGSYYFRRRIPADLVQHFPVAELRFSLKTKSPARACLLADAILHKLEELFFKTRSGMLTDEEIRELLTRYVRSELEEDEKKRATGWELRDSIQDPGAVANDYMGTIETLADALVQADQQQALGGYYADRILQANGRSEPSGSIGYLKLCRESLKARTK